MSAVVCFISLVVWPSKCTNGSHDDDDDDYHGKDDDDDKKANLPAGHPKYLWASRGIIMTS